ncbi:hypothetical protein ACQPXM_39400 [Kribbella sp. CA-253562]|uniref:hypothetical protein n=1 Tax=Kribbella sp. CA-253562 TaxID=3239942 RepID=UPI003D909BB6
MNLRITMLSATTLLLAAGFFGTAAQAATGQPDRVDTAPASAAAPVDKPLSPTNWFGPAALSQCYTSGVMCFWTSPNYTSPNNSILVGQPIRSGDCRKVQPNENYLGSRSFWNKTTITQRVWSSDRCTGQNFLVGTNGKNANAPFIVNSRGGY